MNLLKEALKKRGIGLTLTVDGEPVLETDKEEQPPMGNEEMPMEVKKPEQKLEVEIEDGDDEDKELSELVGDVSDSEKDALSSKKPKSLGERAKMMAMEKLKK